MAQHADSCMIHYAPAGEYVSERDCDCGARIAELEAALRKIVDMQPDGELVAYSWGQEYFRRAHELAKQALDPAQ